MDRVWSLWDILAAILLRMEAYMGAKGATIGGDCSPHMAHFCIEQDTEFGPKSGPILARIKTEF